MIHFSLSLYLKVHKRNENICFRDMPTTYLVFGLIDINPNNNTNKFKYTLNHLKLSEIFAKLLINAILITLNLR